MDCMEREMHGWGLMKMKMKREHNSKTANRRRAIKQIHEKEEKILFEDKVICGKSRVPSRAILTKNSLILDSNHLRLEDILSVSCDFNIFQVFIHSYTTFHTKWVPALFGIARRRHCCLDFTVQDKGKLAEWKSFLEKQGCYVNCTRILVGTKGDASVAVDSVSDATMIRQPRKSFLVILNPCSGNGHARKIYYDKVEPLFKWAGLNCKVIETNGPQHAQALISSFNFYAYPDGIVCVGGDGIVNEVINGLKKQTNEKFRAIPIGIIPAGSDNSLIWTVFGIRDPVTAALAIIKGHIVPTGVIAAQCNRGGAMHIGHTTFYHGFMSDVLEISFNCQRFGPLRYFIAGLIKILHLRYYECEIEYIPAQEETVSCDSALCRRETNNARKTAVQGCDFNKKSNWKSSEGLFLGIIICNHQCKTVQCLKSQSLAPYAKHDDGFLDLLLVEKINLIQLLWFLILMQYGRHISLPFVKYMKVHCARLKSLEGKISCGIDGELVRMDSPVFISVFPHKMYLIGKRDD
ncbi:hypothetical protein SUGI_0213000 [Cryptomeria japonica]|uniref:sphingoid long-chain bases kinase 1 n=1 Tax=Cryptomeria japonica TaxID=3369 RepID=UPI002408E797|nr:sphingoid long-chain bases kinase 1 [Cryptomeria japonica]GLJ13470.1 hypothetical protein SUGI_0213000 [Cryptomeria japonica]